MATQGRSARGELEFLLGQARAEIGNSSLLAGHVHESNSHVVISNYHPQSSSCLGYRLDLARRKRVQLWIRNSIRRFGTCYLATTQTPGSLVDYFQPKEPSVDMKKSQSVLEIYAFL